MGVLRLAIVVVVAVVSLPKIEESESKALQRVRFLPSAAVFVEASRLFAKDRWGTPFHHSSPNPTRYKKRI